MQDRQFANILLTVNSHPPYDSSGHLPRILLVYPGAFVLGETEQKHTATLVSSARIRSRPLRGTLKLEYLRDEERPE